MNCNFIELSPSFLHPYFFTREYMYIDIEEHEIDKILWHSDVGLVKFNKMEGSHPDHPGFKICFVKCAKWRTYEMEQVLRKLDWTLTIKFGTRYTRFRDELFDKLGEAAQLSL